MTVGVEVFGQLELVERLKAHKPHYDHLISIGNPKRLFGAPQPDEAMPSLFKEHFRRILRLEFYDVEEKRHLRPWQLPRKIPSLSDVRKVIKFYRDTRNEASGYTIHCWQGISRSTAFALGILYLITGSEAQARETLKRIRPEAGPHQRIVKWFDQELGSHLQVENDRLRRERMETWKEELGFGEAADVEELQEVDDASLLHRSGPSQGGTNPALLAATPPGERLYSKMDVTLDRLEGTLLRLERQLKKLR